MLGIGPYVGAVRGHVDGQVSDDGDALAVGVLFQCFPLGEEEELYPLPEEDGIGELARQLLHRLGLTKPDGVGPLGPGCPIIGIFEGHKLGVGLQPLLLGAAEVGQLLGPLDAQTRYRPAEDGEPLAVNETVVHLGGTLPPGEGLKLLGQQQPLLGQIVQVNEVGVAGKGGEGLIGGIPKPGGADGENLPVGLAGLHQEGDKIPGALTQRTHAIGGGQGGNGHQNTGTSHGTSTFLSQENNTAGSRCGVPDRREAGETGERRNLYCVLCYKMTKNARGFDKFLHKVHSGVGTT